MINEDAANQRPLKTRGKGKSFLFLLMGIIIIILLLSKIGFAEVRDKFFEAKLEFVFLAAFFLGVVLFLKVFRLKLLLSRLNITDSAKIYFISQAVNEIAPTGSGEITKVLIAKDRHHIPKSTTLVAAGMERFFDTIYLLILASFGLSFIFRDKIGISQIFIPMLLVLLFSVFLFKPGVIKHVRDLLSKTKNRITMRICQFLQSFEVSLISFHKGNRKSLIWGLVLTTVAWLLDGLSHLYLIKAFGYDLAILDIYVIVAVAWLLGTFSFLPGGLGVREGIYVFLLEEQSIPKVVGISVILFQRSLLYSYFFAGSLISLIAYNKEKVK